MLFTQRMHYPANATTRTCKRPVLLRKSTCGFITLHVGKKKGKAQHFVKNYDREKWEEDVHRRKTGGVERSKEMIIFYTV